jgi:hypothetical protein
MIGVQRHVGHKRAESIVNVNGQTWQFTYEIHIINKCSKRINRVNLVVRKTIVKLVVNLRRYNFTYVIYISNKYLKRMKRVNLAVKKNNCKISGKPEGE